MFCTLVHSVVYSSAQWLLSVMDHTSVRTITTILFDLDNTLLYTRELDCATCTEVKSWLEKQEFSREESKKITSEFLQRYREAPAPDYSTDEEGLEQWRLNIWASVLPEKYHHYIDDVYSLWKSERLKRLSLKQSVAQMLDELASDFNLGLITNGPSTAQWEKINNTGCQKYFGSIIVSGDLDFEKPSKDIYYLACRQLQVVDFLWLFSVLM